MIKSNCHTHTTYCDGKNTARQVVEAAIEKGFVSLGFSSHSPMKRDSIWAMKQDSVKSYIDEIRTLREEYKDRIDILCGVEVDSDYSGIDLNGFDYSIGSVHQFISYGEIYEIDYSAERLSEAVDTLFDGDINKMCDEYYKMLSEFICRNNFDVVGHFDLITKFNEKNRYINEDDTEYQSSALNAIDRILSVHPNILFEVNTGAMFRCGNERPYPAPFIMKHLFEKKACITITSDAHCCEALDFAFNDAAKYCRSHGFSESYILTGSGKKKIKL